MKKNISKMPNVLIIVLDAVRADHLSGYGYHRNTTPNIDRISSEGFLYENAISASCWTLESMTSMLTGLLPSRHGVHWGNLNLKDNIPTLTEYLRDAGYRSFCLSNNGAFLNKKSELVKGFDYFWEVKFLFDPDKAKSSFKKFINSVYRRTFFSRYMFDFSNFGKDSLIKKIFKKTILGRFHLGAAETNLRFKRYVRSIKKDGKPFFAMLLYIDAHLPYRPPGRFRRLFMPDKFREEDIRKVNYDAEKFLSGKVKMSEYDFDILRALYDGEIAYLDSKIGELYEFLKRENILDDTLLIITSDHGENIGDHGLMDHRYCLYDTVLKVPLIIRYPEAFTPGKRVRHHVQTLDLFPTIENLLSVESGIEFDGISLFDRERDGNGEMAFAECVVPQPVSSKDEDEIAALSKYLHSLKALRNHRYKFILKSDGKNELYNLKEDPDEENNIAPSNPVIVEDLLQELLRKTGSFNREVNSSDLNLDSEIKERLKSLGYL